MKQKKRREPGKIAFGSSFPGRTLPLQIDAQHTFAVQKMAFLASEEGVDLSVVFKKKLGNGLFGGEGLFNTKLTGPGRVWLQTMPLANIVDVIAAHMPTS